MARGCSNVLVVVLVLCAGGCRRESRPAVDRLPAIRQLPDPFRLASGVRVRSRADWRRRREEIKQLLARYQYGRMPPAPGRPVATVLSREQQPGGAEKRLVRLALGTAGVQMHLGLIVPPGKGPFPAIVHVDHRMTFGVSVADEIAQRGYLVVGYDPNFLDPDEPNVLGPAQAAYPGHDWGTLAVWAWGAMRAVDYLVTLGRVDRRRIAVTGHSRSGKAALLAGALDERFALVVPQGSGCGGAATYRVLGEGAESLPVITKSFPHWFHPRLRGFAGKEQRLPFDQHFLLALVAPRALLTIDARGDLWANPLGTQQAHRAARPVYAFLGAGERLGIFFRPGKHELADEDWRTLLDFADRVFFDRKPAGERRFDRLPFPDAPKAFSWTTPG
jgi:dienelactone hydrolase